MIARSAALVLFLLAQVGQAAPPPGYAVAAAHPLATAAGMEILQSGGNAFDAAVAVSAALAVVEPSGSGIGGGGFWLLHRAKDQMQTMVDGRETAPASATADMYLDAQGQADARRSRDGPLSAGIPGAAAAWVHLSQRYGRLPLAAALAPAIRYAREGYPVDARMARMLGWTAKRLSPDAAAIFLNDGQPRNEGDRILQPALALTLERLAQKGHAGFYEGPVAQKLVDGVRAAGGGWSLADLKNYRVVERAPVTARFRDYRITSAAPPSAGGIALAQILQMLEHMAWPATDPVAARHQVIEAMRLAFRDRTQYLGDPDFVSVPTTRLVSRDTTRAMAASIPLQRAGSSAPGVVRELGQDTSHFSVLDREGNRVAATLSVNLPFGSGYMPAGTGVLLNDEMDDFSSSLGASNAYGLAGSEANAIAPGKRPLSSMTPTFVEGPRGVLILGTPGGSRIITMVLLGVLEFIEGGDAAQVVAAPRYHHQHLPDVVQHETEAFSASVSAGLQAMGHTLQDRGSDYGNMQAVWWDIAGGRLTAASDPRGIGAAQVQGVQQ